MSPALPNVPGVVKVQLHWQVGPDGTAQTVLHENYSGSAPSPTAITALAVAIAAAQGGHLVAPLCTNCKALGATVTDLASNTGAQGQGPISVPGTASPPFNAAQVAVLINHQIAVRYRGGKPRSYLPLGVQADLQDDETWKATSMNLFQSSWAAFVAAVTGITQGSTTLTGLCAVSYYQGYQDPVTHPGGRVTQALKLRPGGPVNYPITSSTVNPKPGTIRNRLQR